MSFSFISKISLYLSFIFIISCQDNISSLINNENIDSEVVVEQLKNELLWKKLSQQMFATKITINSADIDAILNNYKNKVGKIEFEISPSSTPMVSR